MCSKSGRSDTGGRGFWLSWPGGRISGMEGSTQAVTSLHPTHSPLPGLRMADHSEARSAHAQTDLGNPGPEE